MLQLRRYNIKVITINSLNQEIVDISALQHRNKLEKAP